MTEFSDLPDEIIVNILLLLPLIDQKSTRLVSKRLLDLNNAKPIVNNTWTFISNYNELDDYFTDNIPAIYNLKVWTDAHFYSNRRVTKFWQKYGPNVVNLQLHLDVYVHEIMVEICHCCPNLQHLGIYFFVDNTYDPPRVINDFSVALPTTKLMRIDVECDRQKTQFLKPLVDSAASLQSIYIDTNDISSCSNVLQVILPLVQHQIQELSLKGRNVSGKDVTNLLEHAGDNLKVLKLDTMQINVNGINAINLKGLNVIKLAGFSLALTEQSLYNFFRRSSNVTHVSLAHLGPSVSDYVISALANLENLQCLDLMHGNRITDSGITGIFASKVWKKMKHLSLIELPKVTDHSIESILPNLPNLVLLKLGLQQLSDHVLSTIAKNNQLLEFLSVPISSNSSINKLQNMVHLDLRVFDPVNMRGLRLHNLKTVAVMEKMCMEDVQIIFNQCLSLDYVILEELTTFESIRSHNYVKIAPAINRTLNQGRVIISRDESLCHFPHFYKLITSVPE